MMAVNSWFVIPLVVTLNSSDIKRKMMKEVPCEGSYQKPTVIVVEKRTFCLHKACTTFDAEINLFILKRKLIFCCSMGWNVYPFNPRNECFKEDFRGTQYFGGSKYFGGRGSTKTCHFLKTLTPSLVKNRRPLIMSNEFPDD